MRHLLIAALIVVVGGYDADAGTAQDLYNAATADYESSQCVAAIEKYESLRKGPSVKSGTELDAVISMRIGICKVRLDQSAEALPMIHSAMPKLETDEVRFKLDLAEAWGALGDAAYSDYNYERAASSYRKALSYLEGTDRLLLLAKLARAKMFEKDLEAQEAAREAIKILESQPQTEQSKRAAYYTLYGRTLLNYGDWQKAYDTLKTALDMSGGLTLKTSLEETALRYDLATVAWLLGEKKAAESYLFYTGAGRITETPFSRAAYIESPLCGDEEGLKNTDFAIVEFSIRKDGSVAAAHTVYTQGSRSAAEAFGRAASKWHWDPQQVEKIPAFYRVLTRLELRCSNRAGSGLDVLDPFHDRFTDWANKTILSVDAQFDLKSEDPILLHDKLLDLSRLGESKQNALGVIATLSLWLDVKRPRASGLEAKYERLYERQRREISQKLMKLINEHPVDKSARNWIEFQNILQEPFDYIVHRAKRNLGKLNNFLLTDNIINDATAYASISLLLSKIYDIDSSEYYELIHRISQDERLPLASPLRQNAHLMISSYFKRKNNDDKAKEYYEKTGLSSGQCALMSDAPKKTRGIVKYSEYPNSAKDYGMEGWTVYELDVNTEGRPVNIRSTIAYPPFVFTDNQVPAIQQYRFAPSYRPEGNIACTALSTSINYKMAP